MVNKTLQDIAEEIKGRKEFKAKRDRSDLLKLLDMPEGLRYLWKIMTEAGTFQAGLTDPNSSLFAEGKRYIGIKIFNEIMEHAPKKFLQMQNDYKADRGIDIKLDQELQTEQLDDVL